MIATEDRKTVMQIEEFDFEKHYEEYQSWCVGHGVGCPFPGLLKTPGWIVHDNSGNFICCCWTYMSNTTGVYWLAYLTTNPDIHPVKAYSGIKYMLDNVEEIMLDMDYTFGMATALTESLSRFLQSNGWHVNHESVTQLFRKLN